MNLLNQRKEFFSVSIDQIEEFVTRRRMSIQVTQLAEAREYRQSLAMRADRAGRPAAGPEQAAFPTTLLADGSGATTRKPSSPPARREHTSAGP